MRYDTVVGVGAGLLALTPILTAAWAGAALIGRELESGTAQLAWTQSVSPARWLAAKVAVPAALLVSGTVLLTLLHRMLWSADGPLRPATSRQWDDSISFVANGTLATAYALLGLAVGILAGVLQRRALPALGTAVIGLAVLLQALATLRPYLWPVETLVNKDEYPRTSAWSSARAPSPPPAPASRTPSASTTPSASPTTTSWASTATSTRRRTSGRSS
ncbi:hypothetical protein WKI71_21025 [Streptomyces sp. MS1.AVA.1]|uniref:ABC transporter permease n=1 Tax=Streptomyces machairae TaxID=3134109 RepID=A0ABU8UM73_9ACTN